MSLQKKEALQGYVHYSHLIEIISGKDNNELIFINCDNSSQTTKFGLLMINSCVSKLTIKGPDNGLSPGRRQAVIWTNAGLLLIRILGTNFSGILSEVLTFSFKKMDLKMSSGKGRQLFSASMY